MAETNKSVGDGDVVLFAVPAVDEVAVGLPDVVDELVAEGELCDVGQVEGQSLVLPALTEIHLHGVRLWESKYNIKKPRQPHKTSHYLKQSQATSENLILPQTITRNLRKRHTTSNNLRQSQIISDSRQPHTSRYQSGNLFYKTLQ